MTNPTIKDIAREAGVSIASVSRVLNNQGYASEAMKEKVLKTAKELNYYANDIAKSLKSNKTNTIGVLIPDISNPFFMKISKGLEDAISDSKYNLIFTSGMEDINKEKDLLQLLIERRVDGLVLATAGLHTELLNSILVSNIPIILVDRKIKGLKNKADIIIEDNFTGSYQLAKKLIQNGHKNIGVINGIIEVSTGIERYKGFKQAMEDHSLTVHPEYIYSGDYSEEAGKNAVESFLKLDKPPTALLSFNNTMTLGAAKAIMRTQNNRSPSTIASYGEIEFQEYLSELKIYSVRQNPYKMGRIVGERMMLHLSKEEALIVNPQEFCLKPEYNFKLN